MTTFNEMLEANKCYAAEFDQGELPAPPARRVAVITCMDARLHPEKFLGLSLGDAHVIRNAGGRVSEDAIRSLVISEQLLTTNEIVVIHHTGCGMMILCNEDLNRKVRDELGVDTSGKDWMLFDALEQGVRDDIEALRRSELIPDSITIHGAIYEVETGRVREVS
ncbi:MAG: beta-class carbonic anhydrase [Chloroflexota bacterium]